MPPVKVIVVTGGIASGKSTAVRMLQEMGGEGTELFDCDGTVARLQAAGRFSRDLGSLMQLLDMLDGFALRNKRAITIPLLKTMLETE